MNQDVEETYSIYLIQVVLRDGTRNEQRIRMLDSSVPHALEHLQSRIPFLREARLFREIYYQHSSFVEDFDPDNFLSDIRRLSKQETQQMLNGPEVDIDTD